MHLLFYYVLWQVNLNPDLCAVFEALNEIDTLAFATTLDIWYMITESDKNVIEIIMMH